MRKVILVVFSPRLKVWRAHEKACLRKISTAEVHINSSKYQTVCELLTPCRFLHAFLFKRKRRRSEYRQRWIWANPLGGGNASGQVQCRSSALGRMVQLKPHRPPLPAPCPSPWGRAWVFGGVSRPSFLMAPGKSHAESIAKRASRGGRRLWEDKGPWESGILFNILGTRPCKMFI